MNQNESLSRLNNLIEELINKSNKITDHNRLQSMKNLIDELDLIKSGLKEHKFETFWDESEKQLENLPDNVGMVIVRIPTSINWKDKDAILIDFTKPLRRLVS